MTTCWMCHGDWEQCEDCAETDRLAEENKGCHLAEEKGVYIKHSECGYEYGHTKMDFCNKCGLVVNY